MSLASAKSYVNMILNDKNFWTRHENTRDKKKREEVIKSYGFEFTEDDLDVAYSIALEELKSMRTPMS